MQKNRININVTVHILLKRRGGDVVITHYTPIPSRMDRDEGGGGTRGLLLMRTRGAKRYSFVVYKHAMHIT